MSVEIKTTKKELDAAGFCATCFVGILNGTKSTSRTMSKTQKKTVKRGVLELNYHDALLSHGFGLSAFDSSPDPNVVVFTSFPRIFADKNLKVYDVGQNAEHLSQTSDVADLCEGARICVVLIGYDMDEHPINHDSLLHELETYSDVTGMKILHVDTATTGRWYQHLNGELVVLGEGIGLTCNNNDLSDRFETWSNDKTHDDVFSHQMADWLEEVSCEETLNESMSVAFPVAVQDDTQEGQSTMDDVLS